MGGANRPQQQVFNPTAPAVQPLQQMLAQAFMGQAQRPQQNRNPMQGQMPPMMSIFQQLFGGGGMGGGGGGGGVTQMPPPPPKMAPPGDNMGWGQPGVSSGSRSMYSAPGGNMPTFAQMMMRRR